MAAAPPATYVMPDGTVLTGTMVGTTFVYISANGNDATIVPPGSAPESGTFDQSTGILAATDGSHYWIGQNAAGQNVVETATPGPDGTYVTADSTAIMKLPGSGTVLYGEIDGQTFVSISPDGTNATIDPPGGPLESGTFDQSTGILAATDGSHYWIGQNAAGQNIVETATPGPNGSYVTADGTAIMKLPDGTVLYGTIMDGTFVSISADGNNATIVLPNGTVVTGTFDQHTGILTTPSGAYFIGADGVVSATPEPDGSYKLPDGSIVMTPKAWSVDLPAFEAAISAVQEAQQFISTETGMITYNYSMIESAWQSYSGRAFSEVATQASSTMAQLNSAIVSMLARMRTSYSQYVNTEETNANNNASAVGRDAAVSGVAAGRRAAVSGGAAGRGAAVLAVSGAAAGRDAAT